MGLGSFVNMLVKTAVMTILLAAMYTNPVIEALLWATSLLTSNVGPLQDVVVTQEIIRNVIFIASTLWCTSLGRFSMVVVAPVAVTNRLGFLPTIATENMAMDELLTFMTFSFYISLVHCWNVSKKETPKKSIRTSQSASRNSNSKTPPASPRTPASASSSPSSSTKKKKNTSVGMLSSNAIADAKAEQQRRIEERISKLTK